MRWAVAAVAAASLLGGCGSPKHDDAQVADTSTTTSSRPAATSTTAPVLSTTSTTTPTVDLQKTDLAAGTYRMICPGGEVAIGPDGGTATDGRPVSVTRFDPQFTDVTGDGRSDAVIAVNCRAADDGTAGSDSVIVLTSEGTKVTQIGAPIDGTEPVVVGRSIAVRRAAPDSEQPTPTTAATSTTVAAGPGETAAAATAPAPADPAPPQTVRYQAYTYAGDAWSAPAEVAGASGDATVDGLDPYLVGTPYGEIALASGQPVDVSDPLGTKGTCVNVTYPLGPDDVSSLGSEGTVRSVVVANPDVRTIEGVGVGSTEADVEAAYPEQVKVMTSADAPRNRFLVVTFDDDPDRTIMFTVADDAVVRYAVGESGWADVVKGCS